MLIYITLGNYGEKREFYTFYKITDYYLAEINCVCYRYCELE